MTTLTKQPDPGLSVPRGPRKSRKRGKPSDGFRGIGDLKVALFFIAPAMVGLILFYLVPTIRGIYLSFTEYSILGDPEWIGARNYERIAKDPLFWNALGVTSEYVVINIVLQTALALGLAILMHRVAKSTLIRGALLMPYLMANVIAALLWFWMLDYQIGIINQIIEWTGLPRVAFFGSEQWAIPNSVYEAASIDGSKAVSTFWRITLPLLRPVLVLVLVVTVIGSFQVFDTVAVTTAGGPVNATRVLQFYIYQRAFNEQDFGYGSALAVILFLILAIVAFIQMKFLRGNQSDLD